MEHLCLIWTVLAKHTSVFSHENSALLRHELALANLSGEKKNSERLKREITANCGKYADQKIFCLLGKFGNFYIIIGHFEFSEYNLGAGLVGRWSGGEMGKTAPKDLL